jgi:hypothetical protein
MKDPVLYQTDEVRFLCDRHSTQRGAPDPPAARDALFGESSLLSSFRRGGATGRRVNPFGFRALNITDFVRFLQHGIWESTRPLPTRAGPSVLFPTDRAGPPCSPL